MSHLLHRLGLASFRARRRVVAVWLMLAVVVGGLIATVGTDLDESFSIPGTPAQVALDDLERTFPKTAAGAAQVVVTAPGGTITDDSTTQAVTSALTEIAALDGVAAVTDPYTGAPVVPPGAQAPTMPPPPEVVESTRVSDDGSTLAAQVQFDDEAQEVPDSVKADVEQAMAGVADRPGTDVAFGGEVFQDSGVHFSPAELIGILLAFGILALTFRSWTAAAIPIVTAVVGVGVAVGAFQLSSNVIEVSSSAPSLGMMIGLAVGIDYALFIVSRHRELLAEGRTPEDAAARATATAGSAVVFAGATVVIALCGLAVARIPFLTVMGVGAAFSVVVAVAVALTLLPAVLGFLGERLRPRDRMSAARVDVAGTWSGFVRRFRWVVATAAVALLAAIAVPASTLDLALPDNGDQAAGTTQRVAHDTIAAQFGPGYNAPLTVSADLTGSADPLATLDQLATDLSEVDGVQAVTTAVPDPTGATAVLSLVPEGAAGDQVTEDLVTDLRAMGVEDAYADLDLAVTGPTAIGIDVSEKLSGALVPFGLVVVGLSLLLLMLVFRSVLVPLTASLGYLLSTAAAFGAVALVFEHGWLSGLVGLDETGPVVSFLPIMLMGVLFGLAMDYQVFLVSRMHERWSHSRDQGGTADQAVDVGIRQSSRVVVAAAVIMVAVFAAFVPTGDAVIKPIAFALAVGVLFDAFVVRLALVPALMSLLGRHAWWLPAPLARWLPELDVEGATLDAALARSEPEGGSSPDAGGSSGGGRRAEDDDRVYADSAAARVG